MSTPRIGRGLALAPLLPRRGPGRPRKSASAPQASAPTPGPPSMRSPAATVPTLCPLQPRLLDLRAAGFYSGLSYWTVRDLVNAGTLPRVRVPLPNGGEVRRVLVERADLDRLLDAWKDRPEAPQEARNGR
jgi:hypothetical protein